MSIGKKIISFYRSFDVDKKSIWGSYFIERKVFIVAFLFILFLLGVALLTAPANKLIYVYCPLGSNSLSNGLMVVEGCSNPFYKVCNQDVVPCNDRFLIAGSSYGEPFEIDHFHKHFWVYCLGVIGLGFLFNHLKYNRSIKI